jgi:integrase
MKRMNFTDAVIEALPHTASRQIVTDAVIRQLKLRIGARDKVWIFRTAATFKTIGQYPLIDTNTARAVALGLIQNTPLPCMPIQPLRLYTPEVETAPLPTLTTALGEYISTRKLAENTKKDMRARLSQLGSYYDRQLDELTPDAFGKWYTDKSREGKGTSAGATGRYLRALIRWAAVRYDAPSLIDPTMKIRALSGAGFDAKAKSTRLTLDSLPVWWRLVGALPDDATRVLLWSYLMLGARKNELLELHTKDVDIDSNGLVTLTLIDTKNGTDHTLRLGAWLSAQWRDYLAGKPVGLVFAGQATRLRRQVEAIAKAMVSDGVGIHDLRRSFASFAHEAGLDMPTLKACMNHAATAGDVTTRHYLRISPDAMARAWQTVELWILSKNGELK